MNFNISYLYLMRKQKFILVFLLLIPVCYKTKAQDTTANTINDSTIKLITLHERVGEKIDSVEKARYHLFPFWNKEEFSYAYVCQEAENRYKITGVMKDRSFKTVVVTKEDLANMHYQVSYYAGDIKDAGFDPDGRLISLGIRVLFEVIECSIK